MTSRARVGALLLAVAAALAACGGRFHAANPERFGSFRIDVTNDLAPRVEIYLLPDSGQAQDLGGAPVEGTTTYRITPEKPDSQYRLQARLIGGKELVSDFFTPQGTRGVIWVLSTNTLTRRTGP